MADRPKGSKRGVLDPDPHLSPDEIHPFGGSNMAILEVQTGHFGPLPTSHGVLPAGGLDDMNHYLDPFWVIFEVFPGGI